MEKDKFIQAIENHLEDIREQFEIIREYEGKIPAIELDLIMSNIRKVYEVFIKLEKMNQPVVSFKVEDNVQEEKEVAVAEKSDTDMEPPEKDPDMEPEPETVTEQIAEPDPVIEQKTEPGPVIEPVPEPVIEPEPEPDTKNETVIEDKVPESPPADTPPAPVEQREEAKPEIKEADNNPEQPKTTLDLFGESSSTLADSLTDTSDTRVADKLKGEKIKDIKNAIGINEKFLFINELFDGSLKNYEDAIDRLNQCATGEEAQGILDGLLAQYQWDTENNTFQSFTNLVNRKF